MIRSACSSPNDIGSRHGCVATWSDKNTPADTQAYQSSLLLPSGECFIRDTLRDILAVVRGLHEVEEIYVRPIGTGTFEPLIAPHFSSIGTLALVLRRRHPHEEPRIVGIMLAKDESDIIPDVLANLRPQLDALYFHAGDDATRDALAEADPWARSVHVPEGQTGDGMRHYLLQRARVDAEGDRRPLWVMVVQGDEIYADDIRHHVRLAHQERATVISCQVATFVLHESQRDDRWSTANWSLPLEQRLTHYVWDFGEHAGFLDYPWVSYVPGEHMRAHPHGLYPGRYASARPVRKHYPFRSPEQAKARITDRLASGWQPHYENYREIFMGATAAGRQVKRYHGWFGEAERTEGIW